MVAMVIMVAMVAHRYAIFLCSLDVEIIYIWRSSWATNYRHGRHSGHGDHVDRGEQGGLGGYWLWWSGQAPTDPLEKEMI